VFHRFEIAERGADPQGSLIFDTDEFLVAMARHALADDCAVEDIERRERRRVLGKSGLNRGPNEWHGVRKRA